MKKLIFIISIILITSVSCEKNDSKVNNQDFVIQTFTNNSQSEVDSVQLISAKHPLLAIAIHSEYFSKSNIAIEEITPTYGIYYYKNGTAAVLVCDKEGKNVFAYIFNSKTNKFVDAFTAIINKPSSKKAKLSSNESLLKIRSVTSGNVLLDYKVSDINSKGWGNCMRGAVKLLFDDWDNDPGGTFTCWVLSPLCVIGGGIGCVFVP
jgi:hypothetical protein